jgi:uncharacterized protein (DUF2147 family)
MFTSLLAIMLSALAPAPQAADSVAVIGRWQTPVHNGIVEIQRCGQSVCGRILSSDALRSNPDMRDSKNHNAALRDRRLLGLMILSGFRDDGGSWSGGTVYNADDGKIYNAKLTPEGADKLHLRGCVFVPFCKTQLWTRVR